VGGSASDPLARRGFDAPLFRVHAFDAPKAMPGNSPKTKVGVTMNDQPIDIDKWFVQQPDPPEHTYELALVLGGTVSAGAYTAGALDFLIEALDTWSALKGKDRSAPTHNVALRVIAGTSGGGVNAAIMVRALAFQFPHVSRAISSSLRTTGNPFYDTWVNSLRLEDFLDNSDLKSGHLHSVLNGAPIAKAAQGIVTFSGPLLAPPRAYLGVPSRQEPLRVILTFTNLQGVPYRTAFQNSAGEVFVDHADYARFALVYPDAPPPAFRPDEFTVGFSLPDRAGPRLPNQLDWDTFSQFAMATSAFPVGFPPRLLSRPTEQYRYRVVTLPPDESGKSKIQPLDPDWDRLFGAGKVRPTTYQFLAVDGGATDNEPIELARAALCGIGNRNPRDPQQANRGVLLIDPFAGEPDVATPNPDDVLSLSTGLLNALLQQTRYDTSDLLLAADPNIYSRFMISAKREDGQVGIRAIAAGGLGAFIGFACRAFMRHDYLLGRANCQALLRDYFVLRSDNPVMQDCWTPEAIEANGVRLGGQQYVRIIPLLGDVAVPESLDPWPRGALDPRTFRGAFEERWKNVVNAELGGIWWGKFVGWLGGLISESQAVDFIVAKMQEALKEWDLA
jgi:hypothetical protein